MLWPRVDTNLSLSVYHNFLEWPKHMSVILTNDTLDLKDMLWPRVDTNLSLSVYHNFLEWPKHMSVILTNDTLDLKDMLWPRVDTNLSLSVYHNFLEWPKHMSERGYQQEEINSSPHVAIYALVPNMTEYWWDVWIKGNLKTRFKSTGCRGYLNLNSACRDAP